MVSEQLPQPRGWSSSGGWDDSAGAGGVGVPVAGLASLSAGDVPGGGDLSAVDEAGGVGDDEPATGGAAADADGTAGGDGGEGVGVEPAETQL